MKGRLSRALWGAGWFSPRSLLFMALCGSLLFGLVHLLGWRECTCFLSGTSVDGGALGNDTVVRGATYVALYLLFIAVVPVLTIAAGLQTVALRLCIRRRR